MKERDLKPAIVLLLTLLAFALRLCRLDSQPLRGDESFGIQFAAHSWSWLLSNMVRLEPLPPLYYSLLHWWMQALGQSEFVTRFFSLVFGVSAVPLIYALGKSLGRPAVGALAAFLMAINPFQIWHAQDVRNYTAWAALSMAALVFLLRALQEERLRYWASYAGMALLSLYSQYYELFMLLFQNLFFFILFFARRREGVSRSYGRRSLGTWVVIQLALALLYAPWLVRGSSIRLFYQATGESPPLWAVFARPVTVFTLGETVPAQLALVALPFLLLLILFGLGRALKRDRYLGLFLTLYIVVPSLCVFVLAQAQPLFRERYLIVLAPAYYLTYCHALLSARAELPRWKAVPLAVGVAFFSLSAAYSLYNYHWDPVFRKSPDWRALTDYLEAETGRDDAIILNYPDPTFSYYYDGRSASLILPQASLTKETEAETAEALRLVAERYERIWFYPLRDVRWDEEGFVETWLSRHGRLLEERRISGFRWLIYQPVLVSVDEAEQPLAFRLAEAVLLRGCDCDVAEHDESPTILAQPGGTLHVSLYWEAVDRVETSYTVFVHLLDGQDHIWAQQDSLPQGGDFPTDEWLAGDVIVDRYSIALPSDAPAGDYQLVAGMYDRNDGQRLPVFDEEGLSLGDQATIALVKIE